LTNPIRCAICITRMRPNYEIYMQSEHWHSLRAKAIETYGSKCELCRSRVKHPHVHHLLYRQLYDVTTDDLAVVCQFCHGRIHVYLKKHPKALKKRQKLFTWYLCVMKHLQAQKLKRADRFNDKKFNEIGKKTISRLVHLQKKHGKNYAKKKMEAAKGYFKPPSNRPSQAKPSFRTFSSGEYTQDIKNPAYAYRTVSGSESVSPVPCAKNQVSILSPTAEYS